MNKAVFLDRDGTIIEDYGYNHLPDEHLRLLPGAAATLRRMSEAGYLLILITNQSGIGRGRFSLAQYQAFDEAMQQQLRDKGVTITATYYCPHTSKENCDCRKPEPGMVLAAMTDHAVDPAKSFFVGDKDGDILAGKAAGCHTVRISDGKYPEEVAADHVISSLADFDLTLLTPTSK